MALLVQEVPLAATSQTLQIVLAGVRYVLTVRWNETNSAWTLDITDSAGRTVNGIPIITGVDLLAPYSYLNFGGSLVAQTDTDATAVPTYTNLGSTGHLYWVTQ